MKISALFLIILISLTTAASADGINYIYIIDSNGSVQTQELSSSSRLANMQETLAIAKAIANPGEQNSFELKSKRIERVDFFHGVEVSNYSKVAVNTNGETTITEKDITTKGEPFLLSYIIAMLVSMALMTITMILMFFGNKSFVFTLIATIFITLSLAAVFSVMTLAIAAATFVATIFVAIAAIILTLLTAINAGITFIKAVDYNKYKSNRRLNMELYIKIFVIYCILSAFVLFI